MFAPLFIMNSHTFILSLKKLCATIQAHFPAPTPSLYIKIKQKKRIHIHPYNPIVGPGP